MASLEVLQLIEKAKLAFESENYEMAQVHLDEALLQSPDVPEVYFWRGKVATTDLNDEIIETAIGDFTQAIELKPDYWEAYFERGKVFLYFGRFEEAEEDFKKVIQLNPSFKDVYSYLAQIEIQRGNDQKAMEYLNEVSSGGDYKYYYNLGKIFLNAKNYDAAIENFTKALEDNKYLVDGYYLRSKAYEAIGKYKEALEDLKKAATLTPEEKKFFTDMAKVYFKKAMKAADEGDIRKSADLFVEGLKINYNLKIEPEYEKILEEAAKDAMEKGEYQQAVLYLEFAERVVDNRCVDEQLPFEECYKRKQEINALMKQAEKGLPLKERILKKLNDIYAK
ncbi:Tetratricopeptide repeat-containing protein [Persephonella hydrogeniphila]|uniref:Tetratricopeptide repeat-containing protein n=1 Tax=Persephonella hydrogeniphila TaxID=198703 RepID=A0A285NEF3_9AQUI|nr:tetratricopeptide repeat protein [Persephonella hydrogeniphila]SNZ07829.1 Tetratricopeptide repeat-containing protein [Persephonella hydrogeniphila]